MSIRVLNFVGRLSHQGGVQTVVRQILRGLNIEQFESHVCTIRKHNLEENLPELGNHTLYSLNIDGKLSIFNKILILTRLRKLIKKLRPDVMHLHSGQAWYAFIAGIGLNLNYVLEMHYAPGSRQASLAVDWIEQRAARLPNVLTVVHSNEVKQHTNNFLKKPVFYIFYLPLAINLSHFRKLENDSRILREKYKASERSQFVFCAARLVPVKNFSLFIRVANIIIEKIPDTVFMIAGSGSELLPLQKQASDLCISNNIRWLGQLYGSDLVNAYHSSDVFLSTSDYEGFGLTLVEAMAARKPVVSTAVGGTVDIVVDGETGRLCPAGDAEALAAAVLELLEDRIKAMTWGIAGQKRALDLFDLPAFQQGFETIYRQVAGRAAQ